MQLHTKIIIGLILGLLLGIASVFFGISNTITNWVMPFGTIFVKMLKLVAVPLILVSLISGISNLRDTAKLSRIGGKTFSIYILTTVLSIIIALFLANIVQPGKAFPEEITIELSPCLLIAENNTLCLSTTSKKCTLFSFNLEEN